MHVATTSCTQLTEQEYLAGELQSPIRHELLGAHVYAMTGASADHNRITANLARYLGNHLENSPCEVFIADMKLKIACDFYYPDLMVVCAESSDNNNYYRTTPVLVIEVLSPATRKIDKVYKRIAYQSLSSLQEYVLMEQDVVEIEVCRRNANWQAEYYFLGDEVYFAAVDLRLPVANLYARVDNLQMRGWLAQ